MRVTRILGVDPGWASLGLVVAELVDGRLTGGSLVHATTVRTSARKRAGVTYAQRERRRARELFDRLSSQMDGVDLVVSEAPTLVPSRTKSSMSVGRAFGLLDGVTFALGVPVFYFTAGEIKHAATGSTKASKGAVADGVARALPGMETMLERQRITGEDSTSHAYDAGGAILAALADERFTMLLTGREAS
ncbi:MAG: crossover junction endodeoxyribonuclease RuvC [Myxococcota bacterium]